MLWCASASGGGGQTVTCKLAGAVSFLFSFWGENVCIGLHFIDERNSFCVDWCAFFCPFTCVYSFALLHVYCLHVMMMFFPWYIIGIRGH